MFLGAVQKTVYFVGVVGTLGMGSESHFLALIDLGDNKVSVSPNIVVGFVVDEGFKGLSHIVAHKIVEISVGYS